MEMDEILGVLKRSKGIVILFLLERDSFVTLDLVCYL